MKQLRRLYITREYFEGMFGEDYYISRDPARNGGYVGQMFHLFQKADENAEW